MICKTTFDKESVGARYWSWFGYIPAQNSICYLFSKDYKIWSTVNIDDLLPVSNTNGIDNETYIEKTKYGFRVTTQQSYSLFPTFSSLLEKIEQ